MAGNLVTNVATRRCAEPGDLHAAARILDEADAGRPAGSRSHLVPVGRRPGPYPRRDDRRISAWIAVDGWHGWGALKDSSQPG
jgi:hypothetical protein